MTKTQHPEFHLDSQIIHLNHAAVAPWPQRTVNAVANFARENGAVGSTNYLHWLTIEKTLKKQLKQLINAPSINDIALVKNTSEALSFVAYGLNWNSGDNIVSSNIEFPSNRIPWQSLKNQGVEFRQTDLQQDKTPEASLFSNVDKNTRLITISSVQFAAGQHLDLEMIGDFCQQHGILFCIDAIQSLGAIKFDVQRYQADCKRPRKYT
jgi:selenocysteine lyase/cysteine desulfurase